MMKNDGESFEKQELYGIMENINKETTMIAIGEFISESRVWILIVYGSKDEETTWTDVT